MFKCALLDFLFTLSNIYQSNFYNCEIYCVYLLKHPIPFNCKKKKYQISHKMPIMPFSLTQVLSCNSGITSVKVSTPECLLFISSSLPDILGTWLREDGEKRCYSPLVCLVLF